MYTSSLQLSFLSFLSFLSIILQPILDVPLNPRLHILSLLRLLELLPCHLFIQLDVSLRNAFHNLWCHLRDLLSFLALETVCHQPFADEDISKEEIIRQGLISKEDYEQIEVITRKLFQRGTEVAAKHGLILVDTKYEFGKIGDQIYLMDEIHTPDSSRYFIADQYEECFAKGLPVKQLSKEFVREWLMANGFQGKEGQKVPEMTPEIVKGISERYIELYEKVTGKAFQKAKETEDIKARIEGNVKNWLNS